MAGQLILVPTPIDEETPLETIALKRLSEMVKGKDLIVVEELKECRRRWIRWGLKREWIEDFILFNEHTHKEEVPRLIKELKHGRNVYIMSDCGLPAFCDPGMDLVNAAHNKNIKVTSTPFSNSISLAVALSGFSHQQFWFAGFIPIKSPAREDALKKCLKMPETSIIMDTPYRLKRLLPEIKSVESKLGIKRQYFLAMDLNQRSEWLIRGDLDHVMQSFDDSKKEFILIIGS
jgi:16S rRNA (cytidine1402-2'-O)-methyltransferase